MSSKNRLIIFLVDAVITLDKNINAFLIVVSFIEGYMLTASTDTIVTLSIFIYNYFCLSFWLDAWKMVTRE